MVVPEPFDKYQCVLCKKVFKSNYLMKRHVLHKKKPCTEISPDTSPDTSLYDKKIENQSDIIKCEYCNKEFTLKSSLSKHKYDYCDHIPAKEKKALESKRKRREANKKQIAVITTPSNSTPTTITSTTSSSTSSSTPNITTYNISNINFNQVYYTGSVYILNGVEIKQEEINKLDPNKPANLPYIRSKFPQVQMPFGKEILTHITEEMKISLFRKKSEVAFEEMIKLIHNYPGNTNLAISNTNDNEIITIEDNLAPRGRPKSQNIMYLCTNIFKICDRFVRQYEHILPKRTYQCHIDFFNDLDSFDVCEQIYLNYLVTQSRQYQENISLHQKIINNLNKILQSDKSTLTINNG
jgi:hypothetical protein